MTVDARQEAEAIFATHSAQDWMDERLVDALAAAIKVVDGRNGWYPGAAGAWHVDGHVLHELHAALSALREHG